MEFERMNKTTFRSNPDTCTNPGSIGAWIGHFHPFWPALRGFFREDFRNTPKYRANREIKGFGEEKTGLNRPYWIEAIYLYDL